MGWRRRKRGEEGEGRERGGPGKAEREHSELLSVWGLLVLGMGRETEGWGPVLFTPRGGGTPV